MTDIVVTGLGVLSPVGLDVPSFWQAHLAGRSGLRRETRFDLSGVPCGFVGGTFATEDVARLTARWRGSSWQGVLLRGAIEEALADAQLTAPAADVGRVAMVIDRAGSGTSHDQQRATAREACMRRCATEVGLDKRRATRFFLQQPRMDEDVLETEVQDILSSYAERLGELAATISLEATCSTGIRIIVEAARLLQTERADCVVAAVSSSRIDPYLIAGYAQMMALATWKEPPELACKPFDRRRSGMVPAESSAAIVLEREHQARRRGARIYGRLLGWGFVTGLDHPTKLEVAPIRAAMEAALAHGGLSPADVDAVNAHGTSTLLNDLNEARAINATFGSRTAELGIAACKSILGHSELAAAMVESIVAMKMIEHGVVPPVPTCTEPDPDCNLPLSTQPIKRSIRAVLKNAFGFGGQYGCLIFGRP